MLGKLLLFDKSITLANDIYEPSFLTNSISVDKQCCLH